MELVSTPIKYIMEGLKNIENRIKLVEGSFEIISEVGEGTTINIECYA